MGRQYNLDSGFLFHKDWEKALRRLPPDDFHFVFWGLYDFQKSEGKQPIGPHPCKPHIDDIVDLITPKIVDRINGAKGGRKAQSSRGCVGGLCSREKESEEKESEEKESEEESRRVSEARARGRYENVYITESAYAELIEEFGTSIADDYVERLSKYIADKGNNYADHCDTIRTWIKKDSPPIDGSSTFDTDDFFGAAVRKTFGGT